MTLDVITLSVIWDRLIAITQDAAAAMERTTFSPNVSRGNDYCCSLLDLRGRQLAEPPHTLPSFTGTLPFTVRHFLRRFPIEDLRPGDSILTNDTWLGTGHLNDFNVATPVFASGNEPVAIAACTAHMTDVGGSILPGGTTDIFEEGIRIPIVKIVSQGRLNDDLLELLCYNVRTPDALKGDLTGMLAANATMAKRVAELTSEMKIDNLQAIADDIFRRSETAMRAAIREVPHGVYHGRVEFDGAGKEIFIDANVHVTDDAIHVDFAGSSSEDRSSSLNVPLNYTYAFTVYPLKLLIQPRVPNNEGCLRAFSIHAPEGCILNAREPAACWTRNWVGHMIHAALYSALEGVLSERVWAHSGSAPTNMDIVSGREQDGRPFVHVFQPGSGGTGAMPKKDGEICLFPTNGGGMSIEVTEQVVPLMFEEKSIVEDSGGAGMHRGGMGFRWTIRNCGDEAIHYHGAVGRLHFPALGLLGGHSGSMNELYLNGKKVSQGWGRYTLNPSDTFTKVTPGGGGLGLPLLRPEDLVLEDVLEGFVSQEEARTKYGLIVENDLVAGWTDERTQARERNSRQTSDVRPSSG